MADGAVFVIPHLFQCHKELIAKLYYISSVYVSDVVSSFLSFETRSALPETVYTN